MFFNDVSQVGVTSLQDKAKEEEALKGIGGPMTRSKTKKMKQALEGLIMELKEKEEQCTMEATTKWITFLQLEK